MSKIPNNTSLLPNHVRIATWDDSTTIYPVLVNLQVTANPAAPAAFGALPSYPLVGDKAYSAEFSLVDCDEVSIYIRIIGPGNSPKLTKLYMRYQVNGDHHPPRVGATIWSDIRVDDIDVATGLSSSLPYTIEISDLMPTLTESVHVFRFPAKLGQWGRVFIWGDSSATVTPFDFDPADPPIVRVYVYKR